MNIPVIIIINPITDDIFIFSFNITLVHTKERNGVIYAILEILVVSPSFKAIAQEVKAILLISMGVWKYSHIYCIIYAYEVFNI